VWSGPPAITSTRHENQFTPAPHHDQTTETSTTCTLQSIDAIPGGDVLSRCAQHADRIAVPTRRSSGSWAAPRQQDNAQTSRSRKLSGGSDGLQPDEPALPNGNVTLWGQSVVRGPGTAQGCEFALRPRTALRSRVPVRLARREFNQAKRPGVSADDSDGTEW